MSTNNKLQNETLNRPDVSSYLNLTKVPIIVVLDNVRSRNNVGSVFRTSDAFLIEKICLCGITPCPPHRNITKTALGATETVKWQHFDTTISCIKELTEQGYTIISIEQAEHTTMLNNYFPKDNTKLAIIMGNEVTGVAQEIVDISEVVIEIPQYGTKHSLNISVCAGIVIWNLFQKLQGQ